MKFQLDTGLDANDSLLFACERVPHFKIAGHTYDPTTGILDVSLKTPEQMRAAAYAGSAVLPPVVEKRLAALEKATADTALVTQELTDDDKDPTTPGLLEKLKEFISGGGKV